MKKLSQLVREGNTHKQIKYDWTSQLPDGTWGTCAIGGAACALTGLEPIKLVADAEYRLRKELYDLEERYAEHPIKKEMYSVFFIIARLNDDYDWNREQIATWLEREGY